MPVINILGGKIVENDKFREHLDTAITGLENILAQITNGEQLQMATDEVGKVNNYLFQIFAELQDEAGV